jgi:thiamine biosynthesis lipoprotein
LTLRRGVATGLGTLIDIAIDAGGPPDPRDLLAGSFALVDELERALSAQRADSELSRLCVRAHLEAVAVSESLREVIESSELINRQSRGIFDAARGGMRANIKWLDRDRIRFKRPMRLDFGGIAKGYVIDRVVEYLKASGVTAGRVNAGGDMRFFGPTEEPVAVRFGDGFRTIGRVCEGAVAVSTARSHIDGRTGSAVKTTLMVVVFAPRAIVADALTKIPIVCLKTMQRLARIYGAEWRLFPVDLRGVPGDC